MSTASFFFLLSSMQMVIVRQKKRKKLSQIFPSQRMSSYPSPNFGDFIMPSNDTVG